MPAPVESNPKLLAACGLYCAACGAYAKGRCPGCAGNAKATWCQVRNCCAERRLATCAECAEHADPRNCRKYHNLISRVVGLILRSDRRACILRIREVGAQAFVAEMAAKGARTIRR